MSLKSSDKMIMSKYTKMKARIEAVPSDYTYSEAKALLIHMGFKEYTKGKTSGSRVKFYRSSDSRVIMLHKPHPTDVMSQGAVKDLKSFLEEIGEI